MRKTIKLLEDALEKAGHNHDYMVYVTLNGKLRTKSPYRELRNVIFNDMITSRHFRPKKIGKCVIEFAVRREGKTATKKEKVKEINTAIKRSETARNVKAKAEILADGSIQYSVETKTRSGTKYRMKVPFSGILTLLWGEDMRSLKKKYGR